MIFNFCYYYYSSIEIQAIGSKIKGFRGVYPLDKIPFLINGGYIVNTQTSSLPGEHWIAFHVNPLRVAVFDPLGRFYPSILVRKLHTLNRSIVYNKIMYQNPFSNTCGQYCLAWLYEQS